jgi:CHAD domain-containing protein
LCNKRRRRRAILEIEAKFRIPDERTFQRLLETNTLAGYRLGAGSEAGLHDRYLDTADWAVRAWGYACRLRRTGERYLVTLKGLGSATGALHRRVEHEVELAEPLPPRDWPPSSARDLAMRLCGNEPLITLFEIEQTRHSRLLHDRDRTIAELNLDRVTMCHADASQSVITYLELEADLLPAGSEADLELLAIELQEVWGLIPEGRSKYERGMAMFDVGTALDEGTESGKGQRLTPKERAIVERLAQEREVVARRARLLLAWDDGLSRAEMIQRSGLSPRRVRHWLSAFPQQRLGIFPDRVLNTLTEDEVAPSGAQPQKPSSAVLELMSVGKPPVPERVVLLERPGIEAGDPMSEAGRKTFRFHYRRMLYNEPGTRLGEDIEPLHDMRVASRRMRAAFRVFGDYFRPKDVALYLKGLKRTGRALGAVRDLDVFHEKVQAYLETLPLSNQGSLNDLLAVLEAQREVARRRMIAYLDSKKYSRFVDRFGEFVETEGMGSLPGTLDGGEPWPYRVCHVAPMAIYERLAAMRAYDEWVSIPDTPLARFHALRIACKGFRYSLEFFREVLGQDTTVLIEEVVAMQDHLGELQDAVVASGILRDFLTWGTWGHDTTGKRPLDLAAPVVAPGVAAYLAAKQSELQYLLDTFPQAWQRLQGVEFSRMVAEAVADL